MAKLQVLTDRCGSFTLVVNAHRKFGTAVEQYLDQLEALGKKIPKEERALMEQHDQVVLVSFEDFQSEVVVHHTIDGAIDMALVQTRTNETT